MDGYMDMSDSKYADCQMIFSLFWQLGAYCLHILCDVNIPIYADISRLALHLSNVVIMPRYRYTPVQGFR